MRPVAGLPVSVLVGFALMPFGIPLLWFVSPLVTGQEAALSLAVPVSLAIAASALCLGVVYTIDWTAATRIKGVLVLVGLAYFSAAGLFFLKKDLMDRVQKFFSVTPQWYPVTAKDKSYRVQMPFPAPEGEKERLLRGFVRMTDVRTAEYQPNGPKGPTYRYCCGVGQAVPNAGDLADGWLAPIREQMWLAGVDEQFKREFGKLVEGQSIRHRSEPDLSGRQWVFKPDNGPSVRIVQIFVVGGRVYYLSAEGPELAPNDDPAERFFSSFELLARK